VGVLNIHKSLTPRVRSNCPYNVCFFFFFFFCFHFFFFFFIFLCHLQTDGGEPSAAEIASIAKEMLANDSHASPGLSDLHAAHGNSDTGSADGGLVAKPATTLRRTASGKRVIAASPGPAAARPWADAAAASMARSALSEVAEQSITALSSFCSTAEEVGSDRGVFKFF
jgi:hypothetical protein